MIPKPFFRFNIRILPIVLMANLLLLGCATLSPEDPAHPDTSSPMLLKLYQGPLNHLSAVRRGSCPMYPSCSEYARQAMAKHGSVRGWLMATDRLMRCGRDEIRMAPKVRVDGKVKFYDPVDDNDYWWVKK
jgi:putative component of membrane protein insertase Oxa1/YidC/SpoIIIJ protein YidD